MNRLRLQAIKNPTVKQLQKQTSCFPLFPVFMLIQQTPALHLYRIDIYLMH